MSGGAVQDFLSDREEALLANRLYELLAGQTRRYLAGDGSSVSVETAQELLGSTVYTLRLALSTDGGTERDLLTADLEALLRRGQNILHEKLASAERLWQKVCLTAPPIENVFFSDTLAEIGRFFRRYDLRYFAQRVPCSIDYPLCLPVSDAAQGVSFIELYLGALLTENYLLSRFPAQSVKTVLNRSCPDYRDYPINLCEQTLVNAIGLSLIGKPALEPEITGGDCDKIALLLSGSGNVSAELRRAAVDAARQLAVPKKAADYIIEAAESLVPRLSAALGAGSIAAVFGI